MTAHGSPQLKHRPADTVSVQLYRSYRAAGLLAGEDSAEKIVPKLHTHPLVEHMFEGREGAPAPAPARQIEVLKDEESTQVCNRTGGIQPPESTNADAGPIPSLKHKPGIGTWLQQRAEHFTTPLPEPRNEQPLQTFRARIVRGLATPTVIAVTVMAIALVCSITYVALQPHQAVSDLSPVELPSETETAVPTQTRDPAHDSETEHQTIFVHIVGAVHTPGIIEIPYGARVSEALAAAGGPTAEANTSGVNLARKVNDGEQISVPDVSEPAPLNEASTGITGAVAPTGVVNLNTATQEQLESLPRIGPALASRIINWRDANGSFTAIEQLTLVSGIGEKMFAAVREHVTL